MKLAKGLTWTFLIFAYASLCVPHPGSWQLGVEIQLSAGIAAAAAALLRLRAAMLAPSSNDSRRWLSHQ
jgi:hypothetical protein